MSEGKEKQAVIQYLTNHSHTSSRLGKGKQRFKEWKKKQTEWLFSTMHTAIHKTTLGHIIKVISFQQQILTANKNTLYISDLWQFLLSAKHVSSTIMKCRSLLTYIMSCGHI